MEPKLSIAWIAWVSSQNQASNMVQMMVNFIKTKLGSEVVEQLAASFPALKQFLDEAKKEQY